MGPTPPGRRSGAGAVGGAQGGGQHGVGAIGLGAVLIFTDVLPLSGAGAGAGLAVGGLTVLATIGYSVWELRRAGKADRGEAARRARNGS